MKVVFDKIDRTLLVFTFLAWWITGFFSREQYDIVAIAMILTVGLIHGANDLKVYTKISSQKGSQIKILLAYLLSLGLMGGLFYVFPAFALLVFIGFSAYHFGEQQWLTSLHRNVCNKAFAWSYGCLILALVFYFNQEETSQVVRDLSRSSIQELPYFWMLVVSLAGSIVFGLLSSSLRQLDKERWIKELVLLGIFTVIFSYSGLVWSFAIYFILWHSVPSLVSQLSFLYPKVSWRNLWKYVRSSIMYWGISLGALITGYVLLRDRMELMISVFFPFIAAFALPHTWVMTHLLRRDGER